MTKKEKVGCLFMFVRLLTTTPLWYYLLYMILKTIGTDNITWLLFWAYVVIGFVMAILEATSSTLVQTIEE